MRDKGWRAWRPGWWAAQAGGMAPATAFPGQGGVGPSPWFAWEFHRSHTAFPLLGHESTSLSKAETSGEQRVTNPGAIHSGLIPGRKEWLLLNPLLASFPPRMPTSSMSPLRKYPFCHELFPDCKKRKAFSVSLTLRGYATTSGHFLLL